jgi:hypothetical protein
MPFSSGSVMGKGTSLKWVRNVLHAFLVIAFLCIVHPNVVRLFERKKATSFVTIVRNRSELRGGYPPFAQK